MPDDHDNDLFEKVTRQITNRIDILEDSIKRVGDSSNSHPGGSRGGNQNGGSGDSGINGIMQVVQFQNGQILDLKKDLEELKRLLIHNKAKMASKDQPAAAEQSAPKLLNPTNLRVTESPQVYTPSTVGALSYPSSTGPSYHPPPLHSMSMDEHLRSLRPTSHQSFSGTSSNQRNPGYMTEPENNIGGIGRGKRRRRGKRGGNGSGYESDQNSVFSEQISLQHLRRPPSPKSVASMPTGKRKKGKKGANPLTGSWEDIRTDLHV